MKLPALKNSGATSLIDGQSVDEFIRNSTRNLQQVSTTMPGSGVPGAVYLGFDGTTGVYKLAKAPIAPTDVGRILVPQHGMFEGITEWAGGTALQKIQRQLLGVHYDEPMTERMLLKPLSPGAYKKDNDGPTYVLGFIGYMLDDAANVIFEHSSNGAKKMFNDLATTATQALVAFGEIVHPVIELAPAKPWESSYRTIYDPKLNVVGYVTDKRAREVDSISDADIITRPTPSRAKQRLQTRESPAL